MSTLSPRISRAAQAALVVFVGLAFAADAFAQLSVSVAPPYIEKVTRPDTTIRDVIFFRNGGSDPLLVSLTFADFAVDAAGDAVEKAPGTEAASIIPHIRVTPLRARVAPGEQVMFRYTVKAPSQFKQLRALFMFAGEPPAQGETTQVLFVPRVGVPIYVESTAAAPPQLEVRNVKWERSPDARDMLLLSMNVHNRGERNIRPTGTLAVRSRDGFEKTFAFNEGREPVLPGQKRDWTLAFGPVPEGELSVSLRFATSFRDSFATEASVPALAR